jgi:hypothetical protein
MARRKSIAVPEHMLSDGDLVNHGRVTMRPLFW